MQCAIRIVENTLNSLRIFIAVYSFHDDKEEVYFFKYIKPDFLSRLIMYCKIYEIEVNKPKGDNTVHIAYWRKKLAEINIFFQENKIFYHYYLMENSYMDDYLFLRQKQKDYFNTDVLCYERDPDFSTSHDFLAAKILAFEFVEKYVINEINSLENRPPKSNFKWTGSKIDLIELIYAFDSAGCINNGKVNLKNIADFFGSTFNVDLDKNLSRAFYDLRIRDKQTAFLDKLRNNLSHRMETADL